MTASDGVEGLSAFRAGSPDLVLLDIMLPKMDGQQVLAELEARFETDLPVFQGKAGSYDPLDAMRRDAHREVFLVIHRQLALARKEAEPRPAED